MKKTDAAKKLRFHSAFSQKQASNAPASFKKKKLMRSHTPHLSVCKHRFLKGLPASVIVNSNTLKISVLKPHSSALKQSCMQTEPLFGVQGCTSPISPKCFGCSNTTGSRNTHMLSAVCHSFLRVFYVPLNLSLIHI